MSKESALGRLFFHSLNLCSQVSQSRLLGLSHHRLRKEGHVSYVHSRSLSYHHIEFISVVIGCARLYHGDIHCR